MSESDVFRVFVSGERVEIRHLKSTDERTPTGYLRSSVKKSDRVPESVKKIVGEYYFLYKI